MKNVLVVDFSILPRCVERGVRSSGIVSAGMDFTPIHINQIFYQLIQGCFLLNCACIFRLKIFVASANVDYSDRVCVVPFTVCAWSGYCPTIVNASVEIHNIMISDICETASFVPLADLIHRHATALRRSGRVDYNIVDITHFILRTHRSCQLSANRSRCLSMHRNV